jgi:hypothetical protein
VAALVTSFRLCVPAQTVDATPSRSLDPIVLFRSTFVWGRIQFGPKQGSLFFELSFASEFSL